ncbi:MAG: phosphoribosylglycinamide formyltransferase [Pseudohongiellaceae bacterium]
MTNPCRVVVLISGNGSNLQAIMEAGADAGYEVVLAVSNEADAHGLVRAREFGVAAEVVAHRDYDSREAFDTELIKRIDNVRPDLLVLAGFMRILTPLFVHHYAGRVLNIHPSLLPDYRGINTHQRVLEAGEKEHGASVHFVTEELDGGPLVTQTRVAVNPAESATELAARVAVREHEIYPAVVKWYADGRLRLEGNKVFLDGEPLPPEGIPFSAEIAA